MKSGELAVIRSSGSPFTPMEEGRVTCWMRKDDPFLESWYAHFVAKGIDVCIADDGGTANAKKMAVYRRHEESTAEKGPRRIAS